MRFFAATLRAQPATAPMAVKKGTHCSMGRNFWAVAIASVEMTQVSWSKGRQDVWMDVV